jgi:hypothetical protein
MLDVFLELEKIAKRLNLNFNRDWFRYIWITKEQEILTEYLSDCRDPIYEKYGHGISERVENIEKFHKSKDYADCIKRYGGQVINKKSLSRWKFIAKGFKDKKLKEMLLDLCNRVEKNIDSFKKIAALTETNIKKEREHLMVEILLHEWIHVLLEQNNIYAKNWKYNEGLVTYIESLIKNTLEELEECEKNTGYVFQKEYFTNAIIFRDLLRDIDDKEKIEKIKKFLTTK